jgi:hypothetical protein
VSTPWPPPPDLDSIRELVRAADTEEFISNGSPADEYDGEAEALFAIIRGWPTTRLTESDLLPVIEKIWRKSFGYDNQVLISISPALHTLAQQIDRFFGPEAQPQVRNQPSESSR